MMERAQRAAAEQQVRERQVLLGLFVVTALANESGLCLRRAPDVGGWERCC